MTPDDLDKIDALAAAATPGPWVRLEAAWQAAEAALPEGHRLEVIGPVPIGPYVARSIPPFMPFDEWKRAERIRSGPTPALALLSLAEALRGRL